MDDTKHKRITDTFAKFLKDVCHLNILYQPWSNQRYKQEWIINAIDQADYVVIALSISAVVKYEAWVEKSYAEHSSPFTENLKKALDKSVKFPNFGDRIVIVKFPHTCDISIPYDLIHKKVFVLPAELSKFLSYINHHPKLTCNSEIKDNILKEDEIENYRDGRNFLAAIDGVWQTHGRFPSGDSGYVEITDCVSFIPPSPTLSYTSRVDSLQLYDQIYEFYRK